MLNQENLVNCAFRFSVTDAEKATPDGGIMHEYMHDLLGTPAVLQGPRLPPITLTKRIGNAGHYAGICAAYNVLGGGLRRPGRGLIRKFQKTKTNTLNSNFQPDQAKQKVTDSQQLQAHT